MKVLTKEGYVDEVGLFLELTDEQLRVVQDNSRYYMNSELLLELLQSKGDNAHFFGVYHNEGDLNKHIKSLLRDYKSVSWWDRKMNKFYIRRK